ncbi:MAG: hypothetical protein IJR17_02315 [Clostridia bacterium]|nr:hypothetical protein [Clostridia bacterium]
MAGFGIVTLMSVLTVLFLCLLALLEVLLLFALARYILQAFTIRSMGGGRVHPAGAWIPFYQSYCLGRLTGHQVLGALSGCFSLGSLGILVCFYSRGWTFQPYLFAALLLLQTLTFLFNTLIAHAVFIDRWPQYGWLLTTFCVLSLGLLRPIFLFALRKPPIAKVF